MSPRSTPIISPSQLRWQGLGFLLPFLRPGFDPMSVGLRFLDGPSICQLIKPVSPQAAQLVSLLSHYFIPRDAPP